MSDAAPGDNRRSRTLAPAAQEITALRAGPVVLRLSDHSAAAGVGLILLCAYLLTFSGTFRVDDEHILAARAQSLALWGRLDQPQVFGNQRERELQAMGAPATQIEPAQAVVGAALYRVGLGTGWGGGQVLFLQNAILTAATSVVVVYIVAAMGYHGSVAAIVALAFGLGTIAWPYASTYLRDPQAMFGVAVAFLGWVHLIRPGGRRYAAGITVVSGILLGTLSKNSSLVLVPAFGLTLLAMARRIPKGTRKKWAAWALGALLVTFLLVMVPKPEALARFTFDYYAGLARHFAAGLNPTVLLESLVGPFLSPARSMFLFSPPLLLILAVPRQAWKEQWPVLGSAWLAGLLLALAQGLFYRGQWAGAVGWGPRYMLPVLPVLAVSVAPAVDRLLRSRSGLHLLAFVAAAALLAEVPAVVVPWRAAYEELRELGLTPYTYSGAWDVQRFLPFHQVQWLFRFEAWDLVWTRLARAGFAGWMSPTVIGLGGLVSGWLILTTRVRRGAVLAGVAGLAMLVVVGSSLGCDPAWYRTSPELTDAQAFLETRVQEQDTILVDAYGTPAWYRMLATWGREVPWYSLPYEIPGTASDIGGTAPHPDAVRLMEALLEGNHRVWLITSSAVPDFLQGDERTWLTDHGRLLVDRSFERSTRVDVLLFGPG